MREVLPEVAGPGVDKASNSPYNLPYIKETGGEEKK